MLRQPQSVSFTFDNQRKRSTVGKISIILQLWVTFHNLLAAMIKSLWSLKVIRGSERHLVNKKEQLLFM